MIAVTVHFYIKPDHVEEFSEAVLKQASNSLTHEETCRHFDVCQDPDDSAHFFLYELYDDAAAFDRHREADYFADFGGKITDWVAEKKLVVMNVISPA